MLIRAQFGWKLKAFWIFNWGNYGSKPKNKLDKLAISERGFLALGNSNLGSNFECQSTIYNSGKKLPFHLVNHIGVKKWLAEIVISEWKWIWRLSIQTWGQNSECQSTIQNSAKNLYFIWWIKLGSKSGLLKSRFLSGSGFWRLGILTWGQILNVKVPFTTLQKNSHFIWWIKLGSKSGLLKTWFLNGAAFGAWEF